MSRPGVTYLDVAHAAQQVMASGQEPTIERIRAQLKTGSHGTSSDGRAQKRNPAGGMVHFR